MNLLHCFWTSIKYLFGYLRLLQSDNTFFEIKVINQTTSCAIITLTYSIFSNTFIWFYIISNRFIKNVSCINNYIKPFISTAGGKCLLRLVLRSFFISNNNTKSLLIPWNNQDMFFQVVLISLIDIYPS